MTALRAGTPTGTCAICGRRFSLKDGMVAAHRHPLFFERGPCAGHGWPPEESGDKTVIRFYLAELRAMFYREFWARGMLVKRPPAWFAVKNAFGELGDKLHRPDKFHPVAVIAAGRGGSPYGAAFLRFYRKADKRLAAVETLRNSLNAKLERKAP